MLGVELEEFDPEELGEVPQDDPTSDPRATASGASARRGPTRTAELRAVLIADHADAPPPARPDPLAQVVAFCFLAAGAFFAYWFLQTNSLLWLEPTPAHLFLSLFREWRWGGSMEWGMLAWSVGAAGALGVLGWFWLESLELYMPRAVAAALSLIVGLGVAGVALEWIAMAGGLHRPVVALAYLLLLGAGGFLSWRAQNRRAEAWPGSEGGWTEFAMRREMARESFERSLVRPTTLPERAFRVAAIVAIAVVSLAIAWHAILYPETYWDSLILYLGYARMMFHEHGIVRKVVGQVGIGLGANYPHLFSLIGAGAATMAGEWSELPQRLLAPLAGLASTVLVYHAALRTTRHVNFSLAIALLYRSIPIGIAWDQYASDYAITILFAAAFLYAALEYVRCGLRGWFVLATALVAFSMHLNYLMGILWAPWAAMIVAAHAGMPRATPLGAFGAAHAFPGDPFEGEAGDAADPDAGSGASDDAPSEPAPPWTERRAREPLLAFLRSPFFLIVVGASWAIGSTWLIRNWVVTGNPVYAFFHRRLGGINVNPEVMESAAVEWKRNGFGIALFGDTLGERLGATWTYFVNSGGSYLMQPFLFGFAAPGALLLLARVAARAVERSRRAPRRSATSPGPPDVAARFGGVAALLALALFGYHFALAPFYLYQIVMILPALAALAIFLHPWVTRGPARFAFGALVLVVGLVPGVAMGLMGFKVKRQVVTARDAAGRPVAAESQIDLFALRHPAPPSLAMYSWEFGDDARIFQFVNERLRGERILTHDNRHLCYDASIELVHLDDWAMQRLWTLRPEERVARLKDLGIFHYLYVPNEDNHAVNARMGAKDWARMGLAEVEFRAGANVLYRFR